MSSAQNPFSSRFIRPGAIHFRSSGEFPLKDLLRRLSDSNWRGEIVGPHGCGKSTLLQSLKPLLPKNYLQVTLQSDKPLDENFRSVRQQLDQLVSGDLLIVDGVEQLPTRLQGRLFDETDNSNVGLLVTCHESVGLPRLIELKPDIERFRELVEQLLQGSEFGLSHEEIEYAFLKYEPNVREALFSLYDVYEIRRRNQSADS